MSVSVQNIFDGALLWSSANTDAFKSLAKREILERVNFAQQDLFTKLAQENRYFYATSATPASTSAASGRTVDLSAVTPLVERVLLVKLPTGVELNLVDIQDLSADLAPRAYQLGEKLYEVGNEWSGVAGPVTLTVYYVYRPAELNLAATDLSATISTPDRFADYFQVDLAWYLAHKDLGREGSAPGEMERLAAKREAIYATILQYLDHASGPVSRRFHLPVTQPGAKA